MTVHKVRVHVRVFGRTRYEHRHPINTVFPVVCRARNGSVLGIFVAVVIFKHSEIRKLVQQFIQRRIVRSVMLGGVHLMQLIVGVMLPDLEEIPREHIKEQVQRRFAGHGIHLILENAGQSPVLRSIRRHLYLSRDAVRDVTDELQEFRVRILVPFVLRDKFA